MSGLGAGALVLAGRLLRYPGTGYGDDLRAFVELVSQLGLDSAGLLKSFAESHASRSAGELQELFTQWFDMTPNLALDVGWHLFGEEYERGAFLVEMRGKLRDFGIPEDGELPDFLASLLVLVTKLPADEAAAFVERRLLPALDTLVGHLEKAESPFLPIVACTRHVLAAGVPARQEVCRA